MPEAPMAEKAGKPMKIGTEITVRISLTFQEAPDLHTLLAMTPVRERGKLVRLALKRYISETGHPAGDVEQQIHAISTWLRSRGARMESAIDAANQLKVERIIDAEGVLQFRDIAAPLLARSDGALAETTGQSATTPEEVDASSSSIKRWLQA